MEAPDKIYVPTRFRLVDGLRVRESDTDEEYIRKDALLEWLQKEYDTNKWFYDTHTKPGELHVGRCEAYKKVIEKIESL